MFPFFGSNDADAVTRLAPKCYLLQKLQARFGFNVEALLCDERIAGIPPMMYQTFGVPGLLGVGGREQRAGFIDISQAEMRLAFLPQ